MNINDPKLTAYALGELGARETSKVEAVLRNDSTLAAAVEETRATARVVEAGLAGEALPRLTDAQRAAVLAAAEAPSVARRIFKTELRPGGLVGVAKVLRMAASLALIAGGMAGFGLWRVSLERNTRGAVVMDVPKRSDDGAPTKSLYLLSVGPSSQPGGQFITPSASDSGDDLRSPSYFGSGAVVVQNGTLAQNGPALFSVNKLPGDTAEFAYGVPMAPPPGATYGNQLNYKRAAPSTASEKFSTYVSNPRAIATNNRLVITGSSKDLDRVQAQLHAIGYVSGDFDGDGNADLQPLVDDIPNLQGAIRESYAQITDNPFLSVPADPLSTFSIDIDTGSYSNVRRFLNAGQLPPADAVRIEELLNYFSYNYAPPTDDAPFAAHVEIAACPWEPTHRLARIGLKGREIAQEHRPACNLVFLLDVSGSMAPAERLPLIKQALHLMVPKLRRDDRVAIVTYAGDTGVALTSTPASNQEAILNVIDGLSAGGGTNGASGIQLAYQTASENFIQGGINRVILATDGDFNVGVTSQDELVKLIEQEAKTGVFLTVLGVGMGNLKDSTMEKLADKGNGHYAYLDSIAEAKKVLVDEIGATLVTIAKDVKIQVEFNPSVVAAYRLIGYEKRLLAAQDFNDDTKDAGEIGAGHTVTALYELIPADQFSPILVEQWPANPMIDPLKYQTPAELVAATLPSDSRETLTLKLRYKAPDGDVSKLLEFPVTDAGTGFDAASEDFRFASSVAGFGMCLRNSPYRGGLTLEGVQELAGSTLGEDASGYRAEFISLIQRARQIAGN